MREKTLAALQALEPLYTCGSPQSDISTVRNFSLSLSLPSRSRAVCALMISGRLHSVLFRRKWHYWQQTSPAAARHGSLSVSFSRSRVLACECVCMYCDTALIGWMQDRLTTTATSRCHGCAFEIFYSLLALAAKADTKFRKDFSLSPNMVNFFFSPENTTSVNSRAEGGVIIGGQEDYILLSRGDPSLLESAVPLEEVLVYTHFSLSVIYLCKRQLFGTYISD